MTLQMRVRRHLLSRLLRACEKKNPPISVPLTGHLAKQSDYYALYIKINGKEHLFEATHGEKITILSADNTGRFSIATDIEISELHSCYIEVKHFYKGWVLSYDSLAEFTRNTIFHIPFFLVLLSDIKQFFFNKRVITRRDRIAVIRLFVDNTVKDRNYGSTPAELLTELHSSRWVARPDKENLINYYRLIFDSLVHDGELKESGLRYKLTAKGISSLSEYESEERRHKEGFLTQRRLSQLTVVLVFVGFIQAIPAIIQVVKIIAPYITSK